MLPSQPQYGGTKPPKQPLRAALTTVFFALLTTAILAYPVHYVIGEAFTDAAPKWVLIVKWLAVFGFPFYGIIGGVAFTSECSQEERFVGGSVGAFVGSIAVWSVATIALFASANNPNVSIF